MPSKPRRTPPAETTPDTGLERIIFFSDAVIAIAITLLAIDIKVPEFAAPVTTTQLLAGLGDLRPKIVSFIISFVVIGVYWSSHHRVFGYLKRYDAWLIRLNLLFLFFIVLMPFVTGLFGQYSYLPLGAMAYAAAVSLIGFTIGGIWWYATDHHRLVDPGLDEQLIRVRNLGGLAIPLVFLTSIPLALLSPAAAVTLWWLGSFTLVAGLRLMERRQSKVRRA